MTDADRSTDNKIKPFLGCPKKWGGMKMGSENKSSHFLFFRGDTWGGSFGVYWGGGVTYHLLVQYNAFQPCSIVQVRPVVRWFPKNGKIENIEMLKKKKEITIKYI